MKRVDQFYLSSDNDLITHHTDSCQKAIIRTSCMYVYVCGCVCMNVCVCVCVCVRAYKLRIRLARKLQSLHYARY